MSVFDHFVGLALKGLTTIKYWIGWKSIKRRTKKKKEGKRLEIMQKMHDDKISQFQGLKILINKLAGFIYG